MVTAGALVLAGTACGGDDDDAPAPLFTLASPVVTATPDLGVAVGPEIRAEEGSGTFMPMRQDGRDVQPVAVYGARFILAEAATEAGEPQRFVTWDPVTGAREPAWESEADRQDIVTGVAGDLVVYVRTGLELPFGDWRLHVRNLVTGEDRELAAARPELDGASGVHPAPPFGLAPYPAVHEGRLAWVEYMVVDGRAVRTVQLHDLASGTTETIAAADSGEGEDLASATLGGTRVAWVRWGPGGDARIQVMELETGEQWGLDVDASPFGIALNGSGTTVAWDDMRGGKYAVDIASGRRVRFGGDEGWGVSVSGERFAWAPAAAYGGTGGYYDLGTEELRLLGKKPGVQVNQATVMGDWFVWQELVMSEDGQADLEASGYYFLPLGS